MANEGLDLGALIADLEASTHTTIGIAEALSATQLGWAPPDGGWSVGQILEHLCVTTGIYNDHLNAVIAANSASSNVTVARRWKPSWMGGWLTRMLEPKSEKKLPAPKRFVPGEQPREGVIDAYRQANGTFVGIVATIRDRNLALIRTYSPVSRLIRLNLGDCCTIVEVHNRRHLRQIQRLRDHSSFPAPEIEQRRS